MPQPNDAGRSPAGPAGPALPPLGDASRCPSCGVPAPPTAGWCFYCGIALQGELAERARRIGVEAARLLEERWRAVAELRAAVDMGAGPAAGPAGGMATGPAAGPSADMAPPSDRPLSSRSSAAPSPRPARPRPLPAAGPLAEPPPLWPARLAGPPPLPPAALTPPPPPTAPSPPPRPRHWRARHASSEATPWSIQNLLLSLGALLVVVAALIFTLATWGRLGIGGRAVVLAALTGGALGLAALARRRRLTATAEASAVIAVGLLLLDAYAIRRVGLFGLDEPSTAVYQAGALAIVAGLTWLISMPLPLRALQISASVAGQLPLVALVPELEQWQVALLWIVQGTVALVIGNRARRPVRVVLVVGGLAVGFSGLLLAAGDAITAADAAAVLGRALILVVAAVAAVAVGWTWRRLRPAVVIGSATAASALLVAAIAELEDRTSVPWLLAASAGLVFATAAVVLRLPAAWRLGPLLAAGGLGALVAYGVSEHVVQAIVGPLGWPAQRWSISAGRSAQLFVEPFGRPWEGSYAVPLTLAILAAAVAITYRELARIPVRLRLAVLAGLVAGTLLTLPLAAGLTLVAAVLADVVLGLALVAVGVLSTDRRRRLAGLAAGLPVLVIGLFWAAASLSVTLAAVAIALLALIPLTVGTKPPTRSVVLAAGTLLLIAEVEAVAHALDATPGAGAAIATAAAAALAAAGASANTNRDRIAVEVAGCVGVLLGWAGMLAAGWSGPEVATAAPAVVLLVIGRALRRRRTPDQRWSSWAAHGPGLVLGLAPSLAAAVLDDGWVRPLLLGLVGLLVTAVGAQARLQAPLLLGGTVVAVDVAAQLAPYAAAVPRWALVGTAGVALVLAGATYERRLRDLRRVKEGLGRLE